MGDHTGRVNYYLYNAHGDVVQLTGSGGTVTRTYGYDAFGVERDPTSGDANPWRYCGEYYDEETETYYLRARNYSPGIGRFTQEDKYWNPGNMVYGDNPVKWNERNEDEKDQLGLNAYTYKPDIAAIMQSGNLYVYCMNNPLTYKDPSGNIALVDDAAILLVLGTGMVITVTYAWLTSAEGQRAINDGAAAMYNGAVIAGEAVTKAAKAAVGAITGAADWAGSQAKDAWKSITSLFSGDGDVIKKGGSISFAEHKKRSGSKGKTNDKHTKPRPGRDSEKKKQSGNWNKNPNKGR